MQKIGEFISNNNPLNRNNVNVDKDILNNVYDENVANKIRDAVDRPKAIGEVLSEKLNAPNNVKFYTKLAYLYSVEVLFECVSLANEAWNEGRVKTSKAQYFWGILRNKPKGI